MPNSCPQLQSRPRQIDGKGVVQQSLNESAAGITYSSSPNPFSGSSIKDSEIAYEKGWLRHNNGSHYLFVDGHISWYKDREVKGVDDYDGNDGLHPTFSLEPGIKQRRQEKH
jgi:prepilin-type processing-associated H-X9-DG protein